MVSKSWCFTLNNWTVEELNTICEWDTSLISRAIFGKEIGESGTPHLQGVVTFRSAKRLSALKRLLPRAHWEITKCVSASEVYCKKDGRYTVLDFRRGATIGSPLTVTSRNKKSKVPISDSQLPVLSQKLQRYVSGSLKISSLYKRE